MTQASICTIGDEILIGQIVDTNSSHISSALEDIGVKVTRMLSIGDVRDEIVNNLTNELSANQIVIIPEASDRPRMTSRRQPSPRSPGARATW